MGKDDHDENLDDQESECLAWTDDKLRAIFTKVDVDKSGVISRIELKMASKYISKQFKVADAKKLTKLMLEADSDKDGKLNFQEFKFAVKFAQKQMGEK